MSDVFINPRFRVRDWGDLRAPSEPWRVKGVWPEVGLCFVGGPSRAGKSFWLVSAAAAIARGAPLAGARSRRCGVLYVAAEGAGGAEKRIEGLQRQIGSLGGLCKFLGGAIDLTDPADVQGLWEAVQSARQEIGANGVELGVVIIDTLSAATPGVDENTSADLGRVLYTLQRLAAEFRLLVLVAAHTGKNPAMGLRGWSGQYANADGLIMLDLPRGGVHIGVLEKVKDAESGRRFGFRLQQVVLCTDGDGDEITTCVVMECDPEEARATPSDSALAQDAQLVLGLLWEMATEAGDAGVAKDSLRDAAYALGFGGPDPGATDVNRTRWIERRKKAFYRAIKALEDQGKIRVDPGSGRLSPVEGDVSPAN